MQEKDAQINTLEARLTALEDRLMPQPSFATLLFWGLCGVLAIGFIVVMSRRFSLVKK